MAEVLDTKIVDEILIRFDDAGNAKGALLRKRSVLFVDGEKRGDSYDDPEDVAVVADATGRTTLQTVLGDALTNALIAISAANSEIARQAGLLLEADSAIAARDARIAEVEALLAERTRMIGALQDEMAKERRERRREPAV